MKGSPARSGSDLILAIDTPFLTRLPSPPLKPTLSPLVDAKEKLYRRLKEEAGSKLTEMQDKQLTVAVIDDSFAAQAIISVSLLLSSDDFAKSSNREMKFTIIFLGEHLRRPLVDKRQRHHRSLLGPAEGAMRRLRKKKASTSIIEMALKKIPPHALAVSLSKPVHPFNQQHII